MPVRIKSARTLPPTLVSVTWPFVVGFLLIIAVGVFSFEVLMAVRSYSYGENLWAKTQKTATFQLLRYAQTGDPLALERYDAAMRVYQHFHDGHAALIKIPYQWEIIHGEFSKIGIPSPDIEKGAWLYRNFADFEPFRPIFQLWTDAEIVMARLDPLRDELLAYYQQPADGSRPQRLAEIATEIDTIDRLLEPMEMAFSLSLNRTAYWVYLALLGIELTLGSILLIAIIWRTFHFLRRHHRIEQALSAERKRATVTLASLGDAVVSTDPDGYVNYMNPAARHLIQQPNLEVDTTPLPSLSLGNLIHLMEVETGAERSSLATEVLYSSVNSLQSDTDHVLVRPDGTSVPVSWIASRIWDGDETYGMVLVLHDTSREQQLIERLSWLAAYDPLTQLINRREFESRLQHALDTLQQRSDSQGLRVQDNHQHVLMFIDLDQFKIINDTCGHAAGDQVLRLVTQAMLAHVRHHDSLARLGGDEFGLLLLNCPLEAGKEKAEIIRQAISQVNFNCGMRRFGLGASIGLVHLDHSQNTLATALTAADMACYKAKDQGRNRVEIYQADDPHLLARYGEMAWVQRLQSALQENRFCFYAQPVGALQTSEPAYSHYELLIRLRDEDGTLVPPGVFIPAAECFGMMALIDRWVVEHALTLIAHRLKAGTSQPHTLFAINLSGSSLNDPHFLNEIKQTFVRHQVAYRQVCFEITETQAVTHLPEVVRFINEMRALGCSFALDDFGAGMSSFLYLKHLPVDYLKIDGKLIKDIVRDPIDRAMVEMINRLGHLMEIKTVGEYVETPDIVHTLQQIGVNYGQGFAIGHPELWSNP
ncbi:MAG: EAL domain-containing protein [Candidatus Competibacter denitrificans]